jgi:hypothetical protein
MTFAGLKFDCAFLALICLALGSTPRRASAITVEVAKKCEALTAKKHFLCANLETQPPGARKEQGGANNNISTSV